VSVAERAHNFCDITNQVFNRLTVLGFAGTYKKRAYWFCQCECGNLAVIESVKIRSGHTSSCGCLHKEIFDALRQTHGATVNRLIPAEYRAWQGMKMRCGNPNYYLFHRYGGRGITICDRWLHSYENFYADMGKRPSSKHSINRINNDGNYCPENCEWALPKVQARNTSKQVWLQIGDESHRMCEWAELTGTPVYRISPRLRAGWCVRCAVHVPVGRGICTHKYGK
jgi:hypothetical protein